MSAAAPQLRLWTREEYYKMAEIGVFRPGERVELIGGKIVAMAPQYSPHFTAISLTADELRAIFGGGYVVRIQGPLAFRCKSFLSTRTGYRSRPWGHS